jgi:hypothetical protein
MSVRVLLADDAEVMRKAIRRLSSECEDISQYHCCNPTKLYISSWEWPAKYPEGCTFA